MRLSTKTPTCRSGDVPADDYFPPHFFPPAVWHPIGVGGEESDRWENVNQCQRYRSLAMRELRKGRISNDKSVQSAHRPLGTSTVYRTVVVVIHLVGITDNACEITLIERRSKSPHVLDRRMRDVKVT